MSAAAIAVWLSNSGILAASGFAIFVVPGAVLLAAVAAPLRRAEAPAFAFAASLVLLTATFAACLLLGTSIRAAPGILAAVTIATALALRRFVQPSPKEAPTTSARAADSRPDAAATSPRSPRPARMLVVALTFAFVVAAVVFAPVGSVDRWWYLAYVRGYLEASPLTLAEPFLGTGQAFARFGVHPWLFGLAAWSSLSGLDPVVAYEHGAPVLVVLASVSAAWALARELFGEGTRARLCVLATMMLWSGALVPVLARAGEDKVLAASALLPLCAAAFLRLMRASHGIERASAADRDENAAPAPNAVRAGILLLGLAATATAAVHALAYAFVLVALLPTAVLVAMFEPRRCRVLALAAAVLVVIALAPAMSGIVVRERLDDIGAESGTHDHPVVRVHEGRERLVEMPAVGFVVNPRLLLHPLVLLAVVGLWTLGRQRERDGEPLPESGSGSVDDTPVLHAAGPAIGASARLFLLVTVIVPLAIAFVPPLPALAGAVIPPWMVYRVLWLLPLAPLAALAADTFASRYAHREAIAAMLLLALGLPALAGSVRSRVADVRGRLAAPSSDEFRAVVNAVAALPADALVVAAPELAERLPAFTARPVVAALDRSTIVFAGSRERGEARLRARAALLTGDADGGALAGRAGLHPTHAVFDSASAVPPRCAAVLHRGSVYSLCELAMENRGARGARPLETADGSPPRAIADADCAGPATSARRNPWSPAPPAVTCRITVPSGSRESGELLLLVEANTGRATDELRIGLLSRGAADDEYRATVRTTGESAIVLRLPPLEAGTIEVRIASSFLPALRPRRVALATR